MQGWQKLPPCMSPARPIDFDLLAEERQLHVWDGPATRLWPTDQPCKLIKTGPATGSSAGIPISFTRCRLSHLAGQQVGDTANAG